MLATLLTQPNRPMDVGGQDVRDDIEQIRELVDPHRPQGTDGALIELSDGRYMLCMERDELDLFRFEDAVAKARKLRDQDRRDEAADAYRGALKMWRGEPFAGLRGYPFEQARYRLNEQCLTVVEDLYEVELARGRHEEVLPELSAMVAQHPLRERTRAALMIALYRTGRQPQALAEYQELAALNPHPSLALKSLWARMYNFDPLLMLPVAPAAPAMQPSARPRPKSVPHLTEPAKALGGLAMSLFTCGIGAVIYFIYRAIERRRPSLLAPAAVYTAVPILTFASDDGILVAIPLAIVALVHVLVDLFMPEHRWWPRTWWPYSRKSREAGRTRDYWRRYARYNPQAVRQAGIGRPDLGRGADDGGLIDLNTAPADLLTTLPGVTPEVAARILQQRLSPPFTRPEDLETRGVVKLTAELRDHLLILPPP
ncbi:hypothetical protein GCM10009534_75160 [Kribbella sandramycini]